MCCSAIFLLTYNFAKSFQDGILKKHDFSNDSRSRKNSVLESDSDENAPLKPKSSNCTPTVDKEREAIDIAREKNWEAVKRKHEEASKKEEAEAAIGDILFTMQLQKYTVCIIHNLCQKV